MRDIIAQSFSINLNVMRILGLYPPETYKYLYKVCSYITYSIFVVLVSLLAILYVIFDEQHDILQLNLTGIYLAETVSFITKLLPFIRNGSRIKKCINYFGAPYFLPYLNKHKEIIDKCNNICRRNSMAYFTGVLLGEITWNIKPLLMKGNRFPIGIWLPFDAAADTRIYWTTYIFLAAASVYNGFAGTLVDPLIGGLACQATGQLKILKYNLQHLKESAKIETGTNEMIFSDLHSKIRESIELHKAILIFVQEYEECFSWIIFSQFASSVFGICFCCLQLSAAAPMSFNAFSAITYIMIMIGQIYFYCYYATQLLEEVFLANDSLTNAIYMGQWYEYDIVSRKALIIIMERSKKPMIVTAGKIISVTLQTFTM
ncbi:7tm 6 domain containing protein, partial [Asbolus verrucosus]